MLLASTFGKCSSKISSLCRYRKWMIPIENLLLPGELMRKIGIFLKHFLKEIFDIRYHYLWQIILPRVTEYFHVFHAMLVILSIKCIVLLNLLIKF
jgi:hypothetical protein